MRVVAPHLLAPVEEERLFRLSEALIAHCFTLAFARTLAGLLTAAARAASALSIFLSCTPSMCMDGVHALLLLLRYCGRGLRRQSPVATGIAASVHCCAAATYPFS